MGQEGIYVGIDVAKAKVDVARPAARAERWEVPRDEAGIPQLVSEMKTLGPSLVLLEATGGLELPLVAALSRRGTAGGRRQPAPGAGLRQGYWEVGTRPTPWTPPCWPTLLRRSSPPECVPLARRRNPGTQPLTARRQQVMTMLVSEKNRLGAATSAVRPYALRLHIDLVGAVI